MLLIILSKAFKEIILLVNVECVELRGRAYNLRQRVADLEKELLSLRPKEDVPAGEGGGVGTLVYVLLKIK